MKLELLLLREELEGCMTRGLDREGLRVVRRVFRYREIPVRVFASAVQALLMFEDRLEAWDARVERAYARLGRRDRTKGRVAMFEYLVSRRRWQGAAMFMPRRPRHGFDAVLMMWTLLALDRMAEAEDLALICLRMRSRCGSEAETSSVVEALASFAAQSRRWGDAEDFWSIGRSLWPLAPNAWDGLVKLEALKALRVANDAVDAARQARDLSPDDEPKCSMAEAFGLETEFEYRAVQLAKVIPPQERWRFGV